MCLIFSKVKVKLLFFLNNFLVQIAKLVIVQTFEKIDVFHDINFIEFKIQEIDFR